MFSFQTHTVDLRSKLGMRLKREMLITLVTKSMYQDNPDKQNTIFKKYQHFIIPVSRIVFKTLICMGVWNLHYACGSNIMIITDHNVIMHHNIMILTEP